MGHLRRTSNYVERIVLSDSTHMMSMANPMAINVETLSIDSGCSLEKEFTKLIIMNPRMALCQTINQVDFCHSRIRGPSTRDTKDILSMDDHVLTMT